MLEGRAKAECICIIVSGSCYWLGSINYKEAGEAGCLLRLHLRLQLCQLCFALLQVADSCSSTNELLLPVLSLHTIQDLSALQQYCQVHCLLTGTLLVTSGSDVLRYESESFDLLAVAMQRLLLC